MKVRLEQVGAQQVERAHRLVLRARAYAGPRALRVDAARPGA